MDKLNTERVIGFINRAEKMCYSGLQRKQFVLDSILTIYPDSDSEILGFAIDAIVSISKAVTPLLINLKDTKKCCLIS